MLQVPFALQPKAREERIEVLEKGFQLEDDARLTIGAVPSSRTKMMLVDNDVVSSRCPLWWLSLLLCVRMKWKFLRHFHSNDLFWRPTVYLLKSSPQGAVKWFRGVRGGGSECFSLLF